MSSDEDGADLMAAFKRTAIGAPPRGRRQTSFSPGDFVSGESSGEDTRVAPDSMRKLVAVKAPPVRNRHQYTYYEPKDAVERILREFQKRGELMYEVKLTDGRTEQVNFDDLLSLDAGSAALQNFEHDPTPSDDDASSSATAAEDMRDSRLRGKATKTNNEGFVDITQLDLSSEDELGSTSRKPRQRRLNAGGTGNGRLGIRSRRSDPIEFSSSEDSDAPTKRRRKRKAPQEPTRRSSRSRAVPAYQAEEEDDDDDEDEDGDEDDDEDDSSDVDILQSDIFGRSKRKRGRGRAMKPDKVPRTGVRQSDRATRAQNNMQETEINDIYRSDSEPKQPNLPKIASVREVFETLPRSNLFRSRHAEGCEVCYNGPNIAPLIYCQGCSQAYHKNCIGRGVHREHLVTKIGNESFVLQCKRCINIYQKKDQNAPDLSKCQDCNLPGASCRPFRRRKSPQQEQKDRDENEGREPVINVPLQLINNALNVLFRCTKCSRGYHYHHLPPLSQYTMDISRDDEETADERFQEYSRKWLCKDCDDAEDKKVSSLIAWRPSDVETYRPGTSCDMLNEDDKQYLIKWENQSYFRATWHSGAWTWGVTAPSSRKAFFKREDGPKMRTEDAIPEEYLRIDIVLSVKYTSFVDVRSEEIDKARIKEVDKALIKYKGLGYEDAVWEKVPTPEDGDRWLDFVTAYNDWVAGRYVKYPKQGPLKARLEKARGTTFAKLELQKQPENLVGGELMKYQMEGLNWLYYQWYSQKNGILADEMGLGKTIQVIGFLATLVQEHNCFPFLVVVPNSTCANWRREIKQWVPALRVVTFFGSATARDMAYKYEMFPEGSKELRCHVVVTSYEAASDDSCRKLFRGVNWAGLIVDEGQRLKNDKSQLYSALGSVKAPFRLLLTGTPLQNNARELFNLLQFLDETINAAQLEEKYAEMNSENIRELHDQIRPFILRRTKVQVLTFLPPLAQIIVPLSMSHLQKNLYKSILAKSPDLLKALFTSSKSLKTQERANLSNILMQLRKCLCHPFVYSREIEERTSVAAVSHRNLVEASAKLQLLELLLPKLKERGHRVLIFSQFLDMLSIVEDFLDGLQLSYQRLDGTIGSLEKQKRIDQFNAPESPLFAFLLSTRAGGVGINLATADTVIILDPDFNPHQDLQAISRAHRIGQKKKVLCFQLMTRASAEEKMVQMGRKKMALDHVVVEQLDADDIENQDVESILKHGAAELFEGNSEHDIRFDEASIEKLLDRSQMENTKTSGDNSAESQFSFARVWENDQGALADTLDTVTEEIRAPDPGVWDKILKERQAAAAAEALARADALGRGKRARMMVDYATEQDALAEGSMPASPLKVDKRKKRKKSDESASDTDFQAESEDEDSAAEAEAEADMEPEELKDITPGVDKNIPSASKPLPGHKGGSASKTPSNLPSKFPSVTLPPPQPTPSKSVRPPASVPKQVQAQVPPKKAPAKAAVKNFKRAQFPVRSPLDPAYSQYHNQMCSACHKSHPKGACELKIAGAELCGLCGLAHFGHARTCPHIKSETQVRDMLQALKNSPEKKELVDAATKYLRGVKGTLVQQKKRDKEKAMLLAAGEILPPRSAYNPAPSFLQPQPGLEPPRRVVPPSFQGTAVPGPVPGSVGSHLGQRAPNPQTQQQQQQHQHQHPHQPAIEDREVESALRGFLGHE
ncbi:PHD/FYVE-zinc-finger like domain-containing protein [Massariosphaeria phaeospora]|uniref:PHD/FYVE-zinc-finger like domain-containing protein n=1 Tax=Massariosphaeria phaeospora TaxID=100035 RepID=A0A7C8IDM5_9PLEO|nr:PHD/FYVE-zinc-finger like domain-containing protein [Massariosphaeria phaeospora]